MSPCQSKTSTAFPFSGNVALIISIAKPNHVQNVSLRGVKQRQCVARTVAFIPVPPRIAEPGYFLILKNYGVNLIVHMETLIVVLSTEAQRSSSRMRVSTLYWL